MYYSYSLCVVTFVMSVVGSRSLASASTHVKSHHKSGKTDLKAMHTQTTKKNITEEIKENHISLASCYNAPGVPKSGTTWLSTLLSESAKLNCLDPVQKAGSRTCLNRGCSSFNKHSTDLKRAKKETGKFVFVFRDTRDVLCSRWHWAHGGHLNISSFVQDPERGIDSVIKGQNEMMHLADQLHSASHSSTLTYYEVLKNDTVGEISRITAFLRMPLSHSQLKSVVDSASFEAMRKKEIEGDMKLLIHPKSAHTLQEAEKKGKGADELFGVMTRKGEIGGYADELDAALIMFVEAKMAQSLDHRLRLRYLPAVQPTSTAIEA